MTALSWAQVDAWRLSRHSLTTRASRDRLTDVVGRVCGIHAQVMSAAELSIAARVADVTSEDVRAALWRDRTLVKTWCMRGTLHLLPASELPLTVGALRRRKHYRSGAWLRGHGVTLDEMEGILEEVPRALDGRALTREELADALAGPLGAGVREKLLSGWGALLKPAAYRGDLCFGPNRGQNVTFVRPDQWLPSWSDVDDGAAVREVVRRYLAAYGPATHDDFARWWGTDPAEGRRLLHSVGDELEEVEVDGQRAWLLADDVQHVLAQPEPDSVRLLPRFDCYVVGYRPRKRLVADRFAARVFRAAGWIWSVLLVDGVAAGIWDLRRGKGVVEVRLEPFARLSRRRRQQVEIEAEQLGAFLGTRAQVSF